MSLQEVIEIARTLPRIDQIELARSIGTEATATPDELLAMIPENAVVEYWHAATDAAGMDLMHRELAKFCGKIQ